MYLKLISSLFISFACVMAFADDSKLNLTEQDEQMIVDRLNEICGDAWCEGEYELTFTAMKYKAEKNGFYALSLFAENSYDLKNHNNKKIAFTCEIDNTDLVQKIISNRRASISDQTELDFYYLIDDCVNANLYSN